MPLNKDTEDELDRILKKIQAVPHYKGAHSMKIVGKDEARTALHRLILKERKLELQSLALRDYGDTGSYEAYVVVRDRIAQIDSELERSGDELL